MPRDIRSRVHHSKNERLYKMLDDLELFATWYVPYDSTLWTTSKPPNICDFYNRRCMTTKVRCMRINGGVLFVRVK